MDDMSNPFGKAFKKERKKPITKKPAAKPSPQSNLKQTSLLGSSIISKKELDLKSSNGSSGSSRFSSVMSNLSIPKKIQNSSTSTTTTPPTTTTTTPPTTTTTTTSTISSSKLGSSLLSEKSTNVKSIPKKRKTREDYSDEDDAYSDYYDFKDKDKKSKSSSGGSKGSSYGFNTDDLAPIKRTAKKKNLDNSDIDMDYKSPIKITLNKKSIDSIGNEPTHSNFSLDDLLNDRKRTGKFLENIDTDKILLENTQVKESIIKEDNINVKSILGDEIGFNDEETKQLQDLIVPIDLFLTNTNQQCIFTDKNKIPTVMDLNVNDEDIQKYPVLKILNNKDTNELSILNSLSTIIRISTIELIPELLVKYLYSQMCYNKNDLIVSQSYDLLIQIQKKISTNGNNVCNQILSFEYFFNTFNSYSIDIQMDSLLNVPKITDYYSNKKSFNKSFPFINLYRVLSLLNYSIQFKKFTIYQVKEFIKFLLFLSLDPWFSFKIPQNQMNIHEINKKQKKVETEMPSVMEYQVNSIAKSSTVFNSINILTSTISKLIELYFDEEFQKSNNTIEDKYIEETKFNNSDNNDNNNSNSSSNNSNHNSGSNNNNNSSNTSISNESSLLMQQLFDEISSIVKDNNDKFAIYNRIAEILPSETKSKIRERFSLYCISAMLATLPKEKKKKKKSKIPKNEDDEKAQTDSNNNNNNKDDSNLETENKSKEEEKISSIDSPKHKDNTEQQSSNKENENEKDKSNDNKESNQSSSKLSVAQVIKNETFKSDDIISTLIKVIEPYIYRIKNEKINVRVMVNVVQLVNICVDNPAEIKKHYNEIEPLFKLWNSKVKEPENIDFNRTRIKDLIVLIQSKIIGLGIQKSEIVTDYFSTN